MAAPGGPGRDRGAVPHEIHNDPVSGVIELRSESRHLWKAVTDLKEDGRHQADAFNARVRAQADDINSRLNLRDQDHSLFRTEMYARLRALEIWRATLAGGMGLFALLLLAVYRFAGSAATGEVQAVVQKQSEADRQFFESMKADIQAKMIRLEELEKLRKEAAEAAQREDKRRR